jgi:hypothetical protein
MQSSTARAIDVTAAVREPGVEGRSLTAFVALWSPRRGRMSIAKGGIWNTFIVFQGYDIIFMASPRQGLATELMD